MEAQTNPLLEIANAMVRVYKDAFGRGPTKVRARFGGPDLLVVTLEETMTVPEHNLAAQGEGERVSQMRQVLQSAIEDEVRTIIATILGRPPVAFVSGLDPSRDVAVMVFTFAP